MVHLLSSTRGCKASNPNCPGQLLGAQMKKLVFKQMNIDQKGNNFLVH